MAAATEAALLSAGVKAYLVVPITRLYVLRVPAASAVAFQEAAERLAAGICCVCRDGEPVFCRSRVMEPVMGPSVVLTSEMRLSGLATVPTFTTEARTWPPSAVLMADTTSVALDRKSTRLN